MSSLPIALVIAALDLRQFIGWVAPSCVYIGAILDGTLTRLQCSLFCIEFTINMGPN